MDCVQQTTTGGGSGEQEGAQQQTTVDAEDAGTPKELQSGGCNATSIAAADVSQREKLTVWDRYVVHGMIDKGTFSTVSLATLRSEQHLPVGARRQFAIKLITPTSHPTRIAREILCMRKIGGQRNVVGLVDGFRHQGSVGLVMNYIPQEPFHQYYAQLTPAEVQRYLQQLLIALERVHLHGVIHRDVKPSNFLHSPRHGGTYVLVDFGLAQETDQGVLSLRAPDPCPETAVAAKCEQEEPKQAGPVVPVRKALKRPLKLSNSTTNDLAGVPSRPNSSGGRTTAASRPPPPSACSCYGRAQVCNRCLVRPEMNAPRAGTPGYRPPEVLLKYPHQTTAVDIWAAGVIFLGLLSKCYPFFGNDDDLSSLAHMIEVFGYERMRETARALDRTLLCDAETLAKRPYSLRRLCQHFRAIHYGRELGSGAGGGDAGGVAVAGGSSPPSGRDEEQRYGCDNCCKPPDTCLCQRRHAVGASAGDNEAEPVGDTDCDEYGPDAYELLERLLETNPHRRISATEALQHPYFQVQY
ncbi:cell division cycle 7-related protein kinase [Anopheles merus]|uniref:non-specific serine/threonine protein kinase n=1 Tax=Anopheles merus TaxID=30066 RepID=A0A182VEQ3_ANOME|nr:cell division cycle 7-related protein kinase [Anopheles merus]